MSTETTTVKENETPEEAVTEVVERKPDGKVANPRKVVFPVDKHGVTQLMKKESVRAIGRMKGEPEKFKTVMHTLAVLQQHAKAQFKAQQEQNKVRMETAQENERRRKEFELEEEKAALVRKEAEAASIAEDIKRRKASLGIAEEE